MTMMVMVMMVMMMVVMMMMMMIIIMIMIIINELLKVIEVHIVKSTCSVYALKLYSWNNNVHTGKEKNVLRLSI